MEPQSAISPIGCDLIGQGITAFPYLRGHYHRDILHDIWCLIELDKDWQTLFWQRRYEETPVPLIGDLVDWIQFVEHPVDRKSFLIMLTNDTREIAGLVWFYNMSDLMAHGSIWMAKKFRGKHTREAIALGLEYAFKGRNWQSVWAGTPYAIARNLLIRCGFQLRNIVDELYGRPVYLLSCKESDYDRIGRRRRCEDTAKSLGYSAS